MKTGIVMALLLLGVLSPMSLAAADHEVDLVIAVATCVASIASPDGQDEHVRNFDTGVDVIDQDPECLD